MSWFRKMPKVGLVVLAIVAGLVAAACSSSGASSRVAAATIPSVSAVTASTSTATAPTATAPAATTPTATTPTATTPTATTPTATTPPVRKRPKPALPLAGKRVGIDPGHNGDNYTDPAFLNQQIWNGREEEGCDTTGTETDGGYTEARYNWNVANYLKADLIAEGAKVILTRHSNTGIGPCVTTRAQIINHFHADVAVDIHADGGPPGGRGFAILLPVADGPNDRVIGSSKRFAIVLRARFLAVTHMPESTYDGVDGFEPRDDLAGLNLTTVPKVLIECGNMRNATDASMLVTSRFQQLAAKAMAEAITQYLRA